MTLPPMASPAAQFFGSTHDPGLAEGGSAITRWYSS
jgi:hypothetical protein